MATAEKLRNESLSLLVAQREQANKNLPTGEVELKVAADNLEWLKQHHLKSKMMLKSVMITVFVTVTWIFVVKM